MPKKLTKIYITSPSVIHSGKPLAINSWVDVDGELLNEQDAARLVELGVARSGEEAQEAEAEAKRGRGRPRKSEETPDDDAEQEG